MLIAKFEHCLTYHLENWLVFFFLLKNFFMLFQNVIAYVVVEVLIIGNGTTSAGSIRMIELLVLHSIKKLGIKINKFVLMTNQFYS